MRMTSMALLSAVRLAPSELLYDDLLAASDADDLGSHGAAFDLRLTDLEAGVIRYSQNAIEDQFVSGLRVFAEVEIEFLAFFHAVLVGAVANNGVHRWQTLDRELAEVVSHKRLTQSHQVNSPLYPALSNLSRGRTRPRPGLPFDP